MKDCHSHWMPLIGPADPPEVFLKKAAEGGVDGGSIMSMPPASFRPDPEHSQHWAERLEKILEYTSHTPGFYPFFWIDPTEKDASLQIETAVESGISGFKCICNHFYPEECMKEFSQIAESGLPIHFHTGILFDHHVSSPYVQPIAYECLLKIRKIRFALAHLGNPWVDETVLLYAKFQASMRNVPGERSFRVFLDLTPGVSRIRRRDALRMLLAGYADPSMDILWGTDNRINDYDSGSARFWSQFDRKIMEEILEEVRIDPDSFPAIPENLWERITQINYREFLGK